MADETVQDIIVIGAGIIGISSALALQARGRQVL
ncbi:MAG: FAD-dependent oxidoreductase, partial [Pseudomonadota bacterium]|nr:FAD-dependent oxidoreductase [Pseudomonadota bacterium]